MEILLKCTVSVWFRLNRPKLCGNCAFSHDFHTRKFGEISVFLKFKQKRKNNKWKAVCSGIYQTREDVRTLTFLQYKWRLSNKKCYSDSNKTCLSLLRFARNYAETVPFRKISAPGNQVKLQHFTQCYCQIFITKLGNHPDLLMVAFYSIWTYFCHFLILCDVVKGKVPSKYIHVVFTYFRLIISTAFRN